VAPIVADAGKVKKLTTGADLLVADPFWAS
jgi:hypothetical protein